MSVFANGAIQTKPKEEIHLKNNILITQQYDTILDQSIACFDPICANFNILQDYSYNSHKIMVVNENTFDSHALSIMEKSMHVWIGFTVGQSPEIQCHAKNVCMNSSY